MSSLFLVLLFINLYVYRADGAVKCFECTDMPHPSDCEYATTCTASEQCYVEEVISSGGLVLFNSGCKAKTRCAVGRKRDVESSRNKRDDIVVCQDCCDGDYCNDNGCGQQAVVFPQRGLKCYNCKDLINLAECRDLTTCQDAGEVCMVHDFVGPDNQPRYETKCERSLVCDALSRLHGKRSSAGNCVRCCTSDFCNSGCTDSVTGTGNGGSVQSGVKVTTSAPTTLPPVTLPPIRTSQPTLPPIRTSQPTLSPYAFCQQDGYLFFGFIPLCFKIHKQLKSVDEAKAVCQHEQGQLAVIDSVNKWDFIKKVYSQQHYGSAPEFYVDGAYVSANSQFNCAGNVQCSIGQWGSGQPNDAAWKPCLYLNGADDMTWYNSACSDRRMFICTKHI